MAFKLTMVSKLDYVCPVSRCPVRSGGRAKQGRWRRTESTVRTEQRWSFSTDSIVPINIFAAYNVIFLLLRYPIPVHVNLLRSLEYKFEMALSF